MYPNKESFNHAIAKTVVETLLNNGHEVFFHDLYEENFDPIISSQEIPIGASLEKVIEIHCNEINKGEGIIIVHPNWWGQPPSILKEGETAPPPIVYIFAVEVLMKFTIALFITQTDEGK